MNDTLIDNTTFTSRQLSYKKYYDNNKDIINLKRKEYYQNCLIDKRKNPDELIKRKQYYDSIRNDPDKWADKLRKNREYYHNKKNNINNL